MQEIQEFGGAVDKLHQKLLAALGKTLQSVRPDWGQQMAADLLEGRADRLPAEPKSLVLFMLDADSIQDEILASPRPVTATGASMRLRAWDKNVANYAPRSATLLFAGGGNAVFLAPHADLASLLALVDRFETHTFAKATSAHLALSPRELATGPTPIASGDTKDLEKLRISKGAGHFGSCMDALRFQVQLKKRIKDPDTPPLRGDRCVECQRRLRLPDRPRCRICEDRRQEGGEAKDKDLRTFQDLLEIDPRARMAYIFIDGRNIGRRMAEQTTLRGYYELSAALHTAFSLTQHETHRGEPADEGETPEEQVRQGRMVLVEGGDDLMIAMPLSAPDKPDAFHFVLKQVEQITSALKKWDIHVGVGMVIAGSLSADFCMARARELCRQAKRARESSVIHFEHILESYPFSDDPSDLREAETLSCNPPPIPEMRKLYRTQRPYQLDDYKKLLDRAVKLKDVPRTQLSLLAQAFAPGADATTAFITLLYQAARGQGDGASLASALGIDPRGLGRLDELSTNAPHLLRPRPDLGAGAYDTGLLDLIEVSGLLARPMAKGAD